jgi:hypothetical protein
MYLYVLPISFLELLPKWHPDFRIHARFLLWHNIIEKYFSFLLETCLHVCRNFMYPSRALTFRKSSPSITSTSNCQGKIVVGRDKFELAPFVFRLPSLYKIWFCAPGSITGTFARAIDYKNYLLETVQYLKSKKTLWFSMAEMILHLMCLRASSAAHLSVLVQTDGRIANPSPGANANGSRHPRRPILCPNCFVFYVTILPCWSGGLCLLLWYRCQQGFMNLFSFMFFIYISL